MQSVRTRLSVCAAAFLLVFGAGCGGDGPKVVKVSGTLLHKGSPVPHATIHFAPEHGRWSWAQTDAQGRFKVNYDADQDGAIVGKHKVWLENRGIPGTETEPGMPPKKADMSKEVAALFDKYSADKSTLTVQIDKSTDDLKIDLD